MSEKNDQPKAYTILRNDYCCENIKKFKEYLGSIAWSGIYLESNINNAFLEFHDLLCLFYNLCFPKIKMKIKFNRTNKNKLSWISKGIKKNSNTRYINKSKNKCMAAWKIVKNEISSSQKVNEITEI